MHSFALSQLRGSGFDSVSGFTVFMFGAALSLQGCSSDSGVVGQGAAGASSAGGYAGVAGGGAGIVGSTAGTGGVSAGGAGAAAGGSVGGVGGSGAGSGAGGMAGGGGGGGNNNGGAAGSGGTAGCTHLFCEDFESGLLNAAIWTKNTQGGTVEVVKDASATGTWTARLHLNSQGDHAFIVMKAPAGVGNHVFGRASFYLSSPTDKPASSAHTEYMSAGDAPGEKHYELGGYDTSWQTSYWFPGGENIGAGGHVPVKQKACVEWELDDASGAVRVWVNGASNYEFTGAGGGNKFVSFPQLWFGIHFLGHVGAEVDLMLDDIAVDTKRVGCL